MRKARGPVVETSLVYAHGLAAIVTLLISVAFGVLASLELLVPDLVGNSSWLTWGRLRYDHTQGIMLGWLGNAFFAFLYHGVPVLTGRRVTSVKLGQWIFGLWNFAVVAPGWILVLAGFSQPLEWAEFPLVIDAFVVLALMLALIQFLPPFFSRGLEDLYVSSWYIIGGLVFTLLAYPMGNFVPELVPGARGAAFSGLWIHDAIGLFVTPLALAVIYFVIPAATRRPIFSHFLSMLGFWLLFFLYPLNGTHHYVFSVIPMSAQIGAIAASTLLGVDVILVVANLLLSLRGTGWFPRDPACALWARDRFLSDRQHPGLRAGANVGQSKRAFFRLGGGPFASGDARVRHLCRSRRTDSRLAANSLGALQRANAGLGLLALLAGVLVMVSDLTIAGLVEARLWQSAAPWMDSVRAVHPYWLVRALTFFPIGAGFILLLRAWWVEKRGAEPVERSRRAGAGGCMNRFLRMSYLAAASAAWVSS